MSAVAKWNGRGRPGGQDQPRKRGLHRVYRPSRRLEPGAGRRPGRRARGAHGRVEPENGVRSVEVEPAGVCVVGEGVLNLYRTQLTDGAASTLPDLLPDL